MRTGATFADAAAEFLRYCEHDRECKPSTLRNYRSNIAAHLLPAFGPRPLEGVTTRDIDEWRAGLDRLSNRTKNKLLVVLQGVFRRAQHVWGLPTNPVAGVECHRQRASGDIEVFSPEEVLALVRAAASEQDGATTSLPPSPVCAAASSWRCAGATSTSRGRRSAYAPPMPAASSPRRSRARSARCRWRPTSRALSRLADRAHWTRDDDLVFVGDAGGCLDGSALRRRYGAALVRAGLRPLRFHDLRHTFGTRMIAEADIRRVQEWMGHADVQTTMRYLHFAPRKDDAQLVARAFRTEAIDPEPADASPA